MLIFEILRYNRCASFFTTIDQAESASISGTIPIAKALELGLKLFVTYEACLNPRKEHAFGQLAMKIANLYGWNGKNSEKKEWLQKGMRAFAVRFGEKHATVDAVRKLLQD